MSRKLILMHVLAILLLAGGSGTAGYFWGQNLAQNETEEWRIWDED